MRDVEYQMWRHVVAQVDEIATYCENKYGVDRLPKLVSHDLAARFYRQMDKFNAALEAGSPADIEHEGTRMMNAWRVLDAAAVAAGALPLSPRYLEARMPDGRLLVICGDPESHWAKARENRAAVVWSLDEIARVLARFDMVNDAKVTFPGATVTDNRPTATAPPVDWARGDELPMTMVG